MKYLKTYEYENKFKFKFDIGEKVVCIKEYDNTENIKKGETYIIIERKRFSGKNYYAVSDIENNVICGKENRFGLQKNYSYFNEVIFEKIIDYNTKKYNI